MLQNVLKNPICGSLTRMVLQSVELEYMYGVVLEFVVPIQQQQEVREAAQK